MRWAPRSLAGQLLALLLVAMLVSHLIAILLLSHLGNPSQIHPLSAREIETRVTTAYRLIAAQPQLADAALRAFELPGSRFDRSGTPNGKHDAMDPQEAALAGTLRERLGLPADAAVQVHLVQTGETASRFLQDAPPWRMQAPVADPDWAVEIDVPLPDGTWLHGRHTPTMMHPHWDRVLQFSLPVSLLPTILIAVLFGRRIMRPLKALGNTAERVSRGEQLTQLPLNGPHDVREITEAFNNMERRLSAFVRDRTRMIAAIGHDLRTPLASLRIRAELVEDPELREAMIATIEEMTMMAEETLRFGRDDAEREPTSVADLGALIGDVVAQQRLLGRQVAWTAPPPFLYRCRPIHLKRALSNLLDNATRYGETARVAVLSTEDEPQLRIDVEDDGPGIEPDQLERAFEPFTRLDAARGDSGAAAGLGLGLAIARSCIRAHGGEVTLHNKPGGGLRAEVLLPN